MTASVPENAPLVSIGEDEDLQTLLCYCFRAKKNMVFSHETEDIRSRLTITGTQSDMRCLPVF